MGTVERWEPPQKPTSKHHKRTFVCEITVPAVDNDKVIAAVTDAAATWYAKELGLPQRGWARWHIEYGPVHGGWASDVRALLEGYDVEVHYLVEKDHTHEADGCRHKDCQK